MSKKANSFDLKAIDDLIKDCKSPEEARWYFKKSNESYFRARIAR